jgi:PTH1 family peptidyl-tRNA hydrolase
MKYYLVVGLGNVGKEYKTNKHNLGFIVLDNILGDVPYKTSVKFLSSYYEERTQNYTVFYVKPSTLMNLSGEAIIRFKNFYKIDPNDIIVIVDDIAYQVGDLKVKASGGHGGHNGLRNIISFVGSEFLRVRVGIGHPEKGELRDYVLSNFSTNDLIAIKNTSIKIKELIDKKVNGTSNLNIMTLFNTKTNE